MSCMTPHKPKDKNVYRVRFTFNGKQRVLSLHKLKTISAYMCHNIEQLISCKKTGTILSPELIQFIESLDDYIREKLEEWQIITPLQGKKLTLKELLSQYQSGLEGKQVTNARIKEAISIIKRFASWCHYTYPSDITSDGVRAYLKHIAYSGMSARTHNKHLQGIKQFTNWLSIRQECTADLRGINSLNERTDKRLIRRSLTEEERECLLDSLEGYHHGLTAEERKIVYLFALDAGLRWNEIRTLSVGDIDLKNNSLIIQAKNEKARRGAELPLSDELIDELSLFLSGIIKLPSCPLFEGIWKDKAGQMLKVDLKAANIEFRTDEGQVDFHSLRHTFGTRLALSGVTPQIHMALMRHSDINLTMKYYVHFRLNNLKEGLSLLNKKKKQANTNA